MQQNPPATDPIPAIEALEERRLKALVAKDLAEVDRIHDASLLYVHGSGTAEDKQLYMERLAKGHYDYQALTGLRRATRRLGDIVIVDGDVRIQVISGGTPKDFVSRYLQVWIERPDGWKLASVQSTPVDPAKSPAVR